MTDLLRFSASVNLEASAGTKPRRLLVNAYDGRPMMVAGYGNVIVDLTGLELPGSVPILAQHENTLQAVVGQGTPSVVAGALVLQVNLAPGSAADRVVELLQAGIALEASIGAETIQRRYLPAGQETTTNGAKVVGSAGGLSIIEKSRLREVSILPVGANVNTSVHLAAQRMKGDSMQTNETTPPHPVAPIENREEILRGERTRIAGIEAAAKGFEDFPAVMEIRARALEGLATRDDVDRAALEVIRARRPTYAGSFVPGLLGSAPRGAARPEDVIASALMTRCGYESAALAEFGPHVLEASKPLHGASLIDLCKASLQLEGRPVPSDRQGMLRAASVGSMPTALGSSMDKVLATVYRSAPASWRSFAAIKSTPNFRTQNSVRPSFPADLAKLGPSGEIEHTSYAEEIYDWRINTFARQLRVDRQAWINDDLGAFMQVIPSFARSASRTLSNLVAEVLLANSGSHWGSDNGNFISGSDTALNAASLAVAIKKLRQQKDAEGNLLDLQPATLLVPPELEQVGKALVMSADMERYISSTVDQAPRGNPFMNVASVVVEPRLSDSAFTGYSTTAWYLFSAAENESLVVGFLDGRDRPIIEEFGLDADINHLSYGFRCYFDFGCSLADHRASVKSKGAA